MQVCAYRHADIRILNAFLSNRQIRFASLDVIVASWCTVLGAWPSRRCFQPPIFMIAATNLDQCHHYTASLNALSLFWQGARRPRGATTPESGSIMAWNGSDCGLRIAFGNLAMPLGSSNKHSEANPESVSLTNHTISEHHNFDLWCCRFYS